jgi:hypothetical protein
MPLDVIVGTSTKRDGITRDTKFRRDRESGDAT